MVIEFKCLCGATLSADETKAGELVPCSACGLDVPVPKAPAPAAAPGEAAVPGEAVAPGEAAGAPSTVEAFMAEMGGGQPAPTGPSAMDALKADIGKKGDVGEMLRQIHGIEAPAAKAGGAAAELAATLGTTSAADLGAALQGGPAPVIAAADASAPPVGPVGPAAVGGVAGKAKRPAPAGPPTGLARAAHHIGFKRVMWIPTLAMAAVCAGFAAYCFLPHKHVDANDAGITEPKIVTDAQGNLFAIPRGRAESPHEDGTMWYEDDAGQETLAERVVTDDLGRAWAVPQGAKGSVHKNGRFYYEAEGGFEIEAKSADEWLRVRAHEEQVKTYVGGREAGYLQYGIALAAVAVVLAALGLWLLHDVRWVAREAALAAAPVAEVVEGLLQGPAAAGPESQAVAAAAPAEGAAPAVPTADVPPAAAGAEAPPAAVGAGGAAAHVAPPPSGVNNRAQPGAAVPQGPAPESAAAAAAPETPPPVPSAPQGDGAPPEQKNA